MARAATHRRAARDQACAGDTTAGGHRGRTARQCSDRVKRQPAAAEPGLPGSGGGRTRVAAALLAYGHALRARSAWALGAGVYDSAWQLAIAAPPLRPASAAIAILHVGICRRILGDLAGAAEAYETARTRAAEETDAQTREDLLLRARLGEALVTLDRGNLPEAERLLNAVLADATAPYLRDVRARASHDRAVVAWRRERREEAVAWAQQAWALATDPLQREQVLMDLAYLLLGAGFRPTAREAYTLLYETARGPWTRWTAAVNLIEIETLERREKAFARWAAVVEAVEPALPATLRGEYYYLLGLGHRAFGRPAAALTALQRAVQVAEQHRVGELLMRADSARAAVEAGQAAPAPPPAVPSATARELTAAFHAARAATGGTRPASPTGNARSATRS